MFSFILVLIMTDAENFTTDEDENRHQSKRSAQSISRTSFAVDPSYKSRLSVQQSLTSQQTDASNTSYHELVTFDDEGHPFIDINRLIYKPAQSHRHQDRLYKDEKYSWYVPDFSFIVFNLIGLGVSTYFCLIGVSTLTWTASIGMFAVPKCNLTNDNNETSTGSDRPRDFYYRPCETFMERGTFFTDEANGYDWKSGNNFPILRTKLTDVQYFGLVLICIELVNLINVVVGINACLHGYKVILVQHIAVDGVIIMGEFIISAVVAFTSTCELRDLKAIRVVMENFVRWYGSIVHSLESETDKLKMINHQVDALQIGLGCCGVDGWADYLAAAYPNSDWTQSTPQLDDTEMVIPFSCCRSWWIRNIYCSHGVHNWAHPWASKEMTRKFQERIVPEGCIYKLEKLCLNLRAWMGHYGFFASLFHLVCVIIEAVAALVLIKNINTVIRERKQMERHKEMFYDEKDSTLDLPLSLTGRKSLTSNVGKPSQWTKVPPPTEDEVMMIKHRSNFNGFIARRKGGVVGQWMNQAQMHVMDGHIDTKKGDITAQANKQRVKDLLHGKQAQRVQEKRIQEHEYYGKTRPIVKRYKTARFITPKKVELNKPEPDISESTFVEDMSRRSTPTISQLQLRTSYSEALRRKKSSILQGKRTKVLFKKSIIEADKQPRKEEPVNEPVEERPSFTDEERPSFTEEESGMTTATEGPSQTASVIRRRRRRKKKKKKKIIQRRIWQGSWWW